MDVTDEDGVRTVTFDRPEGDDLWGDSTADPDTEPVRKGRTIDAVAEMDISDPRGIFEPREERLLREIRNHLSDDTDDLEGDAERPGDDREGISNDDREDEGKEKPDAGAEESPDPATEEDADDGGNEEWRDYPDTYLDCSTSSTPTLPGRSTTSRSGRDGRDRRRSRTYGTQATRCWPSAYSLAGSLNATRIHGLGANTSYSDASSESAGDGENEGRG